MSEPMKFPGVEFTPELRRLFRRAVSRGTFARRGNATRIDHLINRRAAWKAQIEACAVGGRIGIVVSGMDCDCSQYYRERIADAPRNVVAWLREYERHCEWLDGPETTGFVRPDQVTDGHYESRDLALEAFEDGHAHVVFT